MAHWVSLWLHTSCTDGPFYCHLCSSFPIFQMGLLQVLQVHLRPKHTAFGDRLLSCSLSSAGMPSQLSPLISGMDSRLYVGLHSGSSCMCFIFIVLYVPDLGKQHVFRRQLLGNCGLWNCIKTQLIIEMYLFHLGEEILIICKL